MTKLTKIAIGLGAVLVVVGAVTYGTMTKKVSAPATQQAAVAKSDNPLDDATPGETPEQMADALDAASKVKVIGAWKGLRVYDIHLPPGRNGLDFPITVDGITYDHPWDLMPQLVPIPAQTQRELGVSCGTAFCITDDGQVVGYDVENYKTAVAYYGLPYPPANQVAYYERIGLFTPKAPRKQYGEPTTDSDVPVDIIRNVINADNDVTSNGDFPAVYWKETNTYTRKIGDEKVIFIEYHGTFRIKPDLEQYVGSRGGISYRTDEYEKDGQIAVVKRGNSWYAIKN